MKEREYRKIIENPRHIEGIHSYCDRWCERCPFTLRCSVFAVEQAERKNASPHDKTKESLWPRLEAFDNQARDLIAQKIEHAGVGLAKDPKFKNHNRPVDAHPVGVAAKRYMEFAHKFLADREKEIAKRTDAGSLGVSPAEAIEVVGWFHMMITVKLSRALSKRAFDEEEGEVDLDEMPRDVDGSAKIALIAVDRSILAWLVLSIHEPKLAEAAWSAILTLHRLRVAAEKHFPKARPFVRPGFDTHKFPEKK